MRGVRGQRSEVRGQRSGVRHSVLRTPYSTSSLIRHAPSPRREKGNSPRPSFRSVPAGHCPLSTIHCPLLPFSPRHDAAGGPGGPVRLVGRAADRAGPDPAGRNFTQGNGQVGPHRRCGRAALRQVKVRRMFDSNWWFTTPTTSVFAIDPLGVTSGLTTPPGGVGGPLQRINLCAARGSGTAMIASVAAQIFQWHDDLSYVRANDYKIPAWNSSTSYAVGSWVTYNGQSYACMVANSGTSPTTATTPPDWTAAPFGDRPIMNLAGGTQQSTGEFSWFLTVSPTNSPQGLYAVSVVVCDGRIISAAGETGTTSVTMLSGATGYGGVSVSIPGTWPAAWNLRENQWILLSSVNSTNSNNIKQATLVSSCQRRLRHFAGHDQRHAGGPRLVRRRRSDAGHRDRSCVYHRGSWH